ncbi:hypothetical protein HPP92_001923 [Vanilla planifolia]|uniref:Uncharacterized protein n=1 Tax=Vanilla planifolia TaxID=51239 RepID=A0A835S4Y7_VANPL|nr:hypothetical protein HPP92_002169 [Vanilla planifolia]KAG0501851.1 hypothetical protein HPP92_001923 [Vanilla planifolia]
MAFTLIKDFKPLANQEAGGGERGGGSGFGSRWKWEVKEAAATAAEEDEMVPAAKVEMGGEGGGGGDDGGGVPAAKVDQAMEDAVIGRGDT